MIPRVTKKVLYRYWVLVDVWYETMKCIMRKRGREILRSFNE